ncbi:unnamed protein product, partial [Onchocerca ochengi]|uniref:Transposase n=1 Tax=Onchocerca ochengi TaxID=42157 RepID=A0A182EYY2_ONCOC
MIPTAKALALNHNCLYFIGYATAHNRLKATKKWTKSDPNHAPFTKTPINRAQNNS